MDRDALEAKRAEYEEQLQAAIAQMNKAREAALRLQGAITAIAEQLETDNGN